MNIFLNGLPVITRDSLFEQNTNIPKRKNKRKRIQNKWIKKYGYIKKVNHEILIIDNIIYCHSETLNKINKLKNS